MENDEIKDQAFSSFSQLKNLSLPTNIVKIGKKIVDVKVTNLIESTKKEDALLMYELIGEKEK